MLLVDVFRLFGLGSSKLQNLVWKVCDCFQGKILTHNEKCLNSNTSIINYLHGLPVNPFIQSP